MLSSTIPATALVVTDQVFLSCSEFNEPVPRLPAGGAIPAAIGISITCSKAGVACSTGQVTPTKNKPVIALVGSNSLSLSGIELGIHMNCALVVVYLVTPDVQSVDAASLAQSLGISHQEVRMHMVGHPSSHFLSVLVPFNILFGFKCSSIRTQQSLARHSVGAEMV